MLKKAIIIEKILMDRASQKCYYSQQNKLLLLQPLTKANNHIKIAYLIMTMMLYFQLQ
jgi:hypothetical protein